MNELDIVARVAESGNCNKEVAVLLNGITNITKKTITLESTAGVNFEINIFFINYSARSNLNRICRVFYHILIQNTF